MDSSSKIATRNRPGDRGGPIARGLAAAIVLMASPLAGQTKADPSKAEITLPARGGWTASLVYEGDAGIWTVGAFKCFPAFGCPEIYGLDDKGRFTICVSYGGKWTSFQTIEDREWLGAVAFVDLDPRIPGPEIYTGGKRGNLYQIVAHRETTFDTKVIGRFPAEELHTFVAGELAPDREGRELLAFTMTGDVYDVRPKPEPGAGFAASKIHVASGRVRDVVVIPAAEGTPPWFAGACRSGELLLMRMRGGVIEERTLLREPMGLGRVARRRKEGPEREVLYVTRDDGVVLRCQEGDDGAYSREIIYAGPQGPRGIAAGRFLAEPDAESIAVFGYSRKVELVSRVGKGPWTAEAIFLDRDKGHWLAACEVDGRNGTDELVGAGYGSRIFLLAREPGYGLSGVPTEPVDPLTTAESRPAGASR